jgi:hypothetical protein
VTAAELASAWAAVAGIVSSQAKWPPKPIDPTVWAEVAEGKVARRSTSGDPPTAIGVGVLHATREEAWLSLTDDQMSKEIGSLTEVALRGHWAAPKVVYQRIDLPWPFADRHWVLSLSNNVSLATRSPVWERSWTLASDQLAGARAHTDAAGFDAAEPVGSNDGDWLLLPLASGDTLAVYQARVSLGGAIPDGAVDSYTRSSMVDLFTGIERNVAHLHARYGPGCTPQPGADGAPIPCFR